VHPRWSESVEGARACVPGKRGGRVDRQSGSLFVNGHGIAFVVGTNALVAPASPQLVVGSIARADVWSPVVGIVVDQRPGTQYPAGRAGAATKYGILRGGAASPLA
jgi:hypothetical protein